LKNTSKLLPCLNLIWIKIAPVQRGNLKGSS
jgi:hypothetical protein